MNTMVVVLATWFVHEFGHWITAEMLGYPSGMSMNKTFPKGHYNVPRIHQFMVTASGPVVTIFIATTAYSFLKAGRFWNGWLYLIIFTAFYMRFLAGGMNLINFNDEGKISMMLGLGVFTIPILVSAYLFYLLYRSSKEYALSRKFVIGTLLLIMFFSSALIIADDVLRIQIF